MYYVNVLMSAATGRRYTGSCADLEKRLARHNSGQSLATRSGIPWRIVYHEAFNTRAEAMSRERHLKTGRGRDELRLKLG
jgi:putative endonuclease